jgi:EAL and modified HD-GYP domain-containing signal transduction protein
MEAYVARQPILDPLGRLYGYELLFRSSRENVFGNADFEVATASVIDDCVSVWGLDALAPTGRAFVNFGRQALLGEAWRVLPRERVVIELLETVHGDAAVLAACRQLREDGYALALDDFVWRPETASLLPLADIVKVDLRATMGPARAEVAARLRGQSVRLLAEKVETAEEVAESQKLGFTLFQGYHFCRPQMLSKRETSVYKLNYLKLIDEVNRPSTALERLEEIIRRDVALSVKLLRYLNSAGFGLRNQVTSIRQALCLLGEVPFRKWVTVMAMRMLGSDKPEELTVTSLVRARFCELLAAASGFGQRALELFLVGLLSTIDALVDRPMSELLAELPLATELRDVLLGLPSPLGRIYQLARAWERGDWDEVRAHAQAARLGDRDLGADYRQSLEWVGTMNRSAKEA